MTAQTTAHQGHGRDARLVRDRGRAFAHGGRRGLAGAGLVAVAFFGDGATNIGAFHEASVSGVNLNVDGGVLLI
jgi:hypothetical protein